MDLVNKRFEEIYEIASQERLVLENEWNPLNHKNWQVKKIVVRLRIEQLELKYKWAVVRIDYLCQISNLLKRFETQ